MSEGTETRAEVTIIDELNLKNGDARALLDILTKCEADECDVNGAAYAIQRLVEDTGTLANELYHVSVGGV